MQDEIDEIVEETRDDINKITLEEDKKIRLVYKLALLGIANEIRKNGSRLLGPSSARRYSKTIRQARKSITLQLEQEMLSSMGKASKAGGKGQRKVFEDILKSSKVKYSKSKFDKMYDDIDKYVVRYIKKGTPYKDHKILSARIWKYGKEFEDGINYMIDRAIKEGRSAIDLAKDLEQFVRPSARRKSDWGSCYPNLKHIEVDYNAQRLARTSINHSYQESTRESAKKNPFVTGIQWISAYSHGRTCQLCRDRAENDSYNLGAGIFPIDEVPLDHPNGLCTLAPYIPQSLDEVGEELNRWVFDKEENKMLDDWYIEHGEYFINKKV